MGLQYVNLYIILNLQWLCPSLDMLVEKEQSINFVHQVQISCHTV